MGVVWIASYGEFGGIRGTVYLIPTSEMLTGKPQISIVSFHHGRNIDGSANSQWLIEIYNMV